LSKTRLFFLLLFALLVAARMCHVEILWEGDGLPMAAARQMLGGKTIYRDIWYDKPLLVPSVYLLWGARAGWLLRLAGAIYALLACWIAFRFARDLWSRREGLWAAALLGFFLTFDFASAVVPLASDLLMLAPHLAAVWLAWKRRPFWSGALAGLAFLISPKGLLVAAVCALWNPAGALLMTAGFAAVGGVAAAWLWSAGALAAYWDEVWMWGRLYAGSTFVADPLRNGIVRTLDWLGFHAALLACAGGSPVTRRAGFRHWIGWIVISFAGLAAGLRFFPRYYFQLLPVMVLMAARGFSLMRHKRALTAALLLLVPLVRFGPSYLTALRGAEWRDTAMDRDSRAAAALTLQLAQPGDTLFVWGYRPEIYVYTRLPAATMFLDSQPLTGVPADRHLTQSEPVETEAPRQRRFELARSQPAFVVDGLSAYNPRLAIANYPELRQWFANYREVARTSQTVIYRRITTN
jgi:hypothetical protein